MRISDWSSDVCSSDLLFVARVAQTLLKLVLRLSQGAGQLRQLGATEEHEDHDQDDEELASAEACHAGHGTSLDHAADTRDHLPGAVSCRRASSTSARGAPAPPTGRWRPAPAGAGPRGIGK